MVTQSAFFPLQVPTNMVGASFATIDVDEFDDFIISSCNQLFFDMVDCNSPPSCPMQLNQVLTEIDSGEFLYYLHMAYQNRCAIDFELSFVNHGQKHWWLLIVTPILDDSKTNARLLMTGINITEKKKLQQSLDISRNRYRSVIQSVHDCIVATDSENNIVLFNRAAEKTWGYSYHEVSGKNISMLIPTKFRPQHDSFIDTFSKSKDVARQMSARNVVYGQRKDGSTFPAEVSISKMQVDSKVEFTAIVRDISERSRLLEELQHQATTDVLTGLKNRVYLDKELDNEILRLECCTRPLSLLMLDIDHFKLVNDNHGHAVGDQVLICFSKTIQALLQQHHVFARYGGEEFIILLPDETVEQAIKIANNIRQACCDKLHVNDIKCTVSIGVSLFTPNSDNADSFIKRADIALYQAKAQGRNCVKFHE
ncbi:MAG: diguanylate cyclase [Gammaproteobacteria bacterium]|nr:diguanylate cyclase [Gammaproteobacteria bacterium]